MKRWKNEKETDLYNDFVVLCVFTATTPLTSPGSASAQSPTNTPINIGNFVWDDLDQDGTQDAGEPGLAE
ncbi:hypothetical protein [Candidatus Villigracilis saccharophilus]|uniref:hypothetical protein n=1 Tax=Candidatus Villigracilis saccharophilus TaxID=3140684 RepID=UPI003134849A|nr:hypothetical protein [Anaerolineales bacterium]